ncbi:hypothetical protein DV736_g685, partial [Chaetothyriales sp. CBS 134916]
MLLLSAHRPKVPQQPQVVRHATAEGPSQSTSKSSGSMQYLSHDQKTMQWNYSLYELHPQGKGGFLSYSDKDAFVSDAAAQASGIHHFQRDSVPHSRMLLNSRGERVYIGVAASISFLQLVRDTVVGCIGPSQFSHNATSDNMLETQSRVSTGQPVDTTAASLSLEDKQSFRDVYLAASGGLLDVFSPTEIEDILRPPDRGLTHNISLYRQASIDLVIAIGAQCSSADTFQTIGRSYFIRAQQVAFGSMLEDPSVDMVRVFLLMAFYMLGECRRNAAYMYLGVAARAASALGLHVQESYADMNAPKHQSALRIWMSLWVLDNLFSAACVDAALYMTGTCYCVLQNKLLLGQMCIMKALLFAAGLILGVRLFAKQEIDYEIESGFQHAKDVLEFLAIQSPQAGHYSEILSLLTSAISRRRQNLAARGRKSKHVKRLFAINQGDSGKGCQSGTESKGSVGQQDYEILGGEDPPRMIAEYKAPPNVSVASHVGTDLDGDPFLGWDSLDLLQWDNFPFMNPQQIASNET